MVPFSNLLSDVVGLVGLEPGHNLIDDFLKSIHLFVWDNIDKAHTAPNIDRLSHSSGQYFGQPVGIINARPCCAERGADSVLLVQSLEPISSSLVSNTREIQTYVRHCINEAAKWCSGRIRLAEV